MHAEVHKVSFAEEWGLRERVWWKAGSLIKSKLVAEELGLRAFPWPHVSLAGRWSGGVQKAMQIFLTLHHALGWGRSDRI